MSFKEVEKLSKEEREKKLKELKMELIKTKTKKKEIRKIIARLLTLNCSTGVLKKK